MAALIETDQADLVKLLHFNCEPYATILILMPRQVFFLKQSFVPPFLWPEGASQKHVHPKLSVFFLIKWTLQEEQFDGLGVDYMFPGPG